MNVTIKAIQDIQIFYVRTKENKRNKNLKNPLIRYRVLFTIEEKVNEFDVYKLGLNNYQAISSSQFINLDDEIVGLDLKIGSVLYKVCSRIGEYETDD